MKAVQIFIAIIVFCAVKTEIDYFGYKNCTDYLPTKNDTNLPAFSLDFCRTTNYDSDNYPRCCFIKWETGDGKRRYNCYQITKHQLADIDSTIDSLENSLGGKVKSLDCKSSYLFGSLLLLLFLFL